MSKPSQSLWMLGATLSFALMAVCVKYVTPYYGPAETLFYRSLVSSALVAGWALASGKSIYTPHWTSHSKRAIYGTYSMGVWYYTLGVLPIATSVTLNYSSPIFVALLAAFTAWRLKKSATDAATAAAPSNSWGLYLAIALGFAGVVVLLNPSVSSEHVGPSLLGVSAAFAAAFSFRDVRRLIALGEPEWRLVFYFAANSALYAFIALWFAPLHSHTLIGVLLLVAIGTLGTAGQLFLSRAFGRGHVLMAASLQYSGVIFAAIFGMTLWGEYLPLQSWVGIAIISVAGILATVSTKKLKTVALAE